MDKEQFVELERKIKKQEDTLRFEHFSNRDAYELGIFLTNRIYEKKIDLAVCIRKVNGAILYQHMTEGTSLNNQNWMLRKFHTVCLMERSSYGAWAMSNITGETIATHGLSEKEYVLCGGGFPITLKTGEMVAVLTVSNLPHEEDHHFIVEGIGEFLKTASVRK
jgi:uncharacterized protein (UPF0303 family)